MKSSLLLVPVGVIVGLLLIRCASLSPPWALLPAVGSIVASQVRVRTSRSLRELLLSPSPVFFLPCRALRRERGPCFATASPLLDPGGVSSWKVSCSTALCRECSGSSTVAAFLTRFISAGRSQTSRPSETHRPKSWTEFIHPATLAFLKMSQAWIRRPVPCSYGCSSCSSHRIVTRPNIWCGVS